jgi:hypothetical protein
VHQDLTHYLLGGSRKTAVEHEVVCCRHEYQRNNKKSDQRPVPQARRKIINSPASTRAQ